MSRENLAVRDLWLPALVGALGVLLALAAWGLLVADRRNQVLEGTEDVAAETREAIQRALEQQRETLIGLGDLWASFGLRPPPEWVANVGQRVDRVPGLDYVAWVDPDASLSRIAVGHERSPGEVEVDVEEARRGPDRPRLVGPERDAAGMFAYRIFLPVEMPDARVGVLVARFRVKALLEDVLRARAPGYALSVSWGAEEIFSRGAPSADSWQRWWSVEEKVSLPFDGHWIVLYRPTSEYAAARLTPLPHYLLSAALVLSLVLAVAVHQLRVIARQSRFLVASNRELEERGVELESRVAERTEALEDAVAELEAFNYSVSHDLRSPLGAILNFTAILEEDYREQPLDAEALAILARIRRSAARATALLEGLLSLSRAGRAALTFEWIDMNALAREIFAQVRAAVDDPDVEEVELIVEPLPEVAADRSLLGDVFANLFSNALKYSRGCEKRRITVRGRTADDECIYEVADNGQGFDMRFVGKLFGLFERLHDTEEVEGTGVGLAMVARVVKRHGGRVWAHGRPGEGARFFFALPRRRAP